MSSNLSDSGSRLLDRFNILSASDIHLFHPFNGTMKYTASMIEQTDARLIELVGDIIDFEEIYRRLKKRIFQPGVDAIKDGRWDIPFENVLELIDFPQKELHLRFLDMIMAKVAEGREVRWYPGNHDENLMVWDGKTIQGIRFQEKAVVDRGPLKMLIQHGHQIDPGFYRKYQGLVYGVGSAFLSLGMRADAFINPLISAATRGRLTDSFAVTNTLKAVGKGYTSSTGIKAALLASQQYSDEGVNAVMNGHTHKGDVAIIAPVTKLWSPAGSAAAENALIVAAAAYQHFTSRAVPLVDTDSRQLFYLNTGDGFNHGTALGFLEEGNSVEEQFHLITRRDVGLSPTFVWGNDNPFAAYRPQTKAFLEQAWRTCLDYIRKPHKDRKPETAIQPSLAAA